MFTLVFVTVVNYVLYNRAIKQGTIIWGKIDFASQFVLIFLAFTSIWTMGLMGAVRSLVRKYFHTYNLMPDFTAESFTPTLSYSAWWITGITVVFFTVVSLAVFVAFGLQFEGTRTRRQSCSCQGQVRLDAARLLTRTRICMGNVIKKLVIGLVVGGALVGICERAGVSLRVSDAVLRLSRCWGLSSSCCWTRRRSRQ